MPPTVTAPVTSTLRDYLKSKGVKLEAQRPQTLKALEIILPVPTRWTQVPDPNVPDAFAVIADRVGGNSVYTSNAQVVVYKLSVTSIQPKPLRMDTPTVSNCSDGRPRTPHWPTSTASPRRKSRAPTARTT